jgi:hypothetical protein
MPSKNLDRKKTEPQPTSAAEATKQQVKPEGEASLEVILSNQ